MKAYLGFIATLVAGTLFGFGLSWSTMIRPEVVISFLTFDDLGLLFVLGAATGLNLLVFQILPRIRKASLSGSPFETRPFKADRRSLLGGALFGIGWGICGVCPAPALAGLGAGNFDLLIAVAGIFIGALLHGLQEGKRQYGEQ
ncbi:MAG: YeeE/YedE family protein [Pseudomonadales bacterium]|nr:YeeE/YedE family protein [Pseudomonadales bacterium]